MKIRSIKPEFFSDPKIVKLSPMARILYIGLWCYVDDEGRGEWIPKMIDGALFPLEQVDIHGLLGELVNLGRVVPYEVGDRMYFYLPTFERYQKPNRKYESKLPKPPPAGSQQDVSTADAVSAQRVSTADEPITLDDVKPPCQTMEEPGTARTQRVRSAHAHAGEGEGEGEGVGSSSNSASSLSAAMQGQILNHTSAFKMLRKRKRWDEFEEILMDWSDDLGPEGLAAAVDQFGRLVREQDMADTPAVLRIACERTATIRTTDPGLDFDAMVARLEAG